MEVGLGVFGMSPRDFWSLTIPEFNAKLRGWREVNCPTKGPSEREADEIRDDMATLLEMFPDGEMTGPQRRKFKKAKAEAQARWQTTS